MLREFQRLVPPARHEVNLALELPIPRETLLRQVATFDGVADGTARLSGVMAVAESALPGERIDISEAAVESVLSMPKRQFAQARGIDCNSTTWDKDELPGRCRMPALAISADVAHHLGRIAEQAVE